MTGRVIEQRADIVVMSTLDTDEDRIAVLSGRIGQWGRTGWECVQINGPTGRLGGITTTMTMEYTLLLVKREGRERISVCLDETETPDPERLQRVIDVLRSEPPAPVVERDQPRVPDNTFGIMMIGPWSAHLVVRNGLGWKRKRTVSGSEHKVLRRYWERLLTQTRPKIQMRQSGGARGRLATPKDRKKR